MSVSYTKGLSPELVQLRTEYYSKARECGWILDGGRITPSVHRLFTSNKGLPIDELRTLLFSSKYVQLKPISDKEQLKNEFYKKAKVCGWKSSNGGVNSSVSAYFKYHEHLPSTLR